MKETATPPETCNGASRTMPARRIDSAMIAEMAKLCAKNLTESEACRRLEIKPRRWFEWKSRCNRTAKFTELFEAFRAGRIEKLLDRIEDSAEGKGGVRYPDWRAAAALLKFFDNKRFGDTPEHSTPPVINLQINVSEVLDKVRARKMLEAAQEPKQIANEGPKNI